MPEFLSALTQQPCRLSTPALVCSLGDNLADIAQRLFSGERGLTPTDSFTPGRSLPLGLVHTKLPDMQAWRPNWLHCALGSLMRASAWYWVPAPPASVKPNRRWRIFSVTANGRLASSISGKKSVRPRPLWPRIWDSMARRIRCLPRAVPARVRSPVAVGC